jgi:hypothetical protein
MKSRKIRLRPLAAAVAVVTIAGLAADVTFARSPVYVDDSGKSGPDTRFVVNDIANTGKPARYIVRFEEQPLALYNGVAAQQPVNGITPIPTKRMANGRTRLDVNSTQAKSYLAYLNDKHQQHLGDIATALGRVPTVKYQMKHALNAAVVELSSADVTKVLNVPGVVAVERDRPHAPATDIGPGFIGAASIWWGTPAGQDSLFADGFEGTPGYRGDGLVIGDIDTGYNSMSPSFQATDGSGYTVTNPLGSGVFLAASQCNVAGISLAGCNDKVIGVYDEIDLTGSDPSFAGQYSVEDTQGHGSHTGSTAGGDGRSATLAGYTAPISGVAPHANLVIYYACSPDPTILCSTAATTASVDQAIADGIVDALNYSISGGTDPWNDSTSLAFMAASDAGIFVAAAAGNTGTSAPNQVPGTANHLEPWVTTVAAGTHTGGAIAPDLSLTGPGTPPANVQNIPLTEGAGDVPPTATITAAMNLSPYFHNSDLTGSDGCTAYAGGAFAGAVALVSRGSCTFITKVNNAVAAGAIAVIISDNRPEAPLTPSVPGATVPVYSVTQAQGTNLQTWLASNSNTAPAVIPYPPVRQPSQPDVLANFSLLGPATTPLIKPDVQAPGVDILAAVANDGTANGPDLVALFNGTSMATPHTTGSGALMLGLHPDWTPQEAKSALMMTALEAGLTKADATTPSDFFDRGSGRLQDWPASKAGLVLNETGANFTAANPGSGGDPSTLNVPSMQSNSCLTLGVGGTTSTNSCTFTRLFRTTQNHTVTWTAAFTGVSAAATPPALTVAAGALPQPISVTVDASSYASDDTFHFGEMTLTPDDTTLPTLHLPIAVKVPPPAIAVAPSPLVINIPHSGTTKSGTLTVTNTGGPTLNVSNTNDTTSFGPLVILDQASQGNNGDYSDLFTDIGPEGIYMAEDFQVTDVSTNLSKLSFPGFVTGSTSLAGYAGNNIHFEIYADNAGVPNGNPETVAPSYIWNYVAVIGSTPGLSVAGNTISIDLAAAGAAATALPAGTYWLVAYPETQYSTSAWAQFESVTTFGNNAHVINPLGDFGFGTNWIAITDPSYGATNPGMALHIEASVPCGAAWLSTNPPTMSIGGLLSAPLTVTANSALFAPAPGIAAPGVSRSAYLCIDSNDANHPVVAVPVTAIQH